MSINVIKFDWDVCKQVDEIFAKHNVSSLIRNSYKFWIRSIREICTILMLIIAMMNM